ncbi:sphingosine 1-phosphate receptor 2 [Latimeria chalumnae]|uniref:Sphingosine-1-phosphate receptor 2 n=1 Tax=Latimeria chalumnae TaxID=7897 RepID=H3AJA0_LATCH|nr:PREDICTED: sphingosine 1-phosphate receptor 2 [Latimeria chalumnae]XP_006005944.1 PREDICTED: sphingosine 1-phosphate receptor 2 [Latimeria chalumnae]|eukprot:XP_006005943.1 PREDICTED: sphingosine 1-phosphate receptor 2 [Latimeria chalumnae]
MGNVYAHYNNDSLIFIHYNRIKNLNSTKYTQDKLAPISVVFIIICCFIILENLLVLIAVWRNKKFHSAMFFFIGNLAFSDLLTGSTYIANILLSGSRTLSLTPIQWFLREGTAFTALSASVLSLLAIAIERQIAITKVKVYSSDKNCRMVVLIGACWIMSTLFGSLPIFGWNCIGKVKACSNILPLYSKDYILFVVTVLCAILISIVLLYARIYLIVKSSNEETAAASQNMALLKTVTIVVGGFIICWLPAFIILLLDFSCDARSCPILSEADYFFGLAILNSLLNPIIYTLRSRDMRKAMFRVLCCWGIIHKSGSSDHCIGQLRSSSSLDRYTHKYELPSSPIMKECTTCM